jgi:uncharacterized SAM-binding protein YcdF (DUF218 family)
MTFSKRYLVVSILSAIFFINTIIMDFPTQSVAAIGDSLVISDNLYPVDVIHVIAGEDYRTQYAIQLYKQGFAKMIFFTGGWCVQHKYFHGVHALELALEEGIPSQAIVYDDSPVSSTYDEALLFQKYLVSTQPTFHSVMVVSDPYHMRRVQWTYRRILGKGFTALMAPVPFDQTPFAEQWWSDAPSRRYVREEYQKMVYYFFRYQLNLSWLAGLDKD